MKRKYIVILVIGLGFLVPSLSQSFHKNKGKSTSVGTVSNGTIINAYRLPYKGANFRYFSAFDYHVLGRCYLHSEIYQTVIDSYKNLSSVYPNYTFKVMECSRKKGGPSFPHRTHQNGTSVDFMTPLKKNGKAILTFDRIGIWRYLMKFDASGKARINKNIEIDFDKMALHVLTLEKEARRNGYRIKKVILETNLRDEIYKSKYGKDLKESNIYFVKNLPKIINELHDDHYHIDFEKI